MPHFYFHLHNDHDVPDEEGREFPTVEDAVGYAEEMVRFEVSEIVKEESRITLTHRIDVEDEQRSVVASVLYGAVVEIQH